MPYANNQGVQIYHVLIYAKQMPNVATLVLPGLNHAQTSAAVDLIVPRALEFLATGK